MIQKRPFRDSRNQWWIYRSDDPLMHRPLGPFFTPEYAIEVERSARSVYVNAPYPSMISGPQPMMPAVEHYR